MQRKFEVGWTKVWVIPDLLQNWQLDQSGDGEVKMKDDPQFCSLGKQLDEGRACEGRAAGERVCGENSKFGVRSMCLGDIYGGHQCTMKSEVRDRCRIEIKILGCSLKG